MGGEEPPTGTVTFLFTDIVDSSRLWDRHPIQMRAALEQHDALLSAAIAANDGYVFTTAGDSFAAAFPTADDAARAAFDIHAAIDGEEWDPATPVRVRIGLHTGEAHERGGDYFGPAVNRAARIEAAGHGGQILCSGVTARVLAQSTSQRWDLTDLGQHHLKGLTQPEHIHQLGLGDHPAPSTGARSLDTLPADRTPFVGRADDVARVTEAIRDHRLVVLTGVGGVGKTRLAVEAARRASSDVAGGVAFVELSAVTSPAAVASAFASVLGIEERPDRTLTESIVAALDQTEPLVVLDNCEHVIDAAAELVGRIVEATSAVHVLCTSRETLALDGEVVVHVTPHPVDTPNADGVQLFLDRARAVAPDADLSDLEAVTELCSRLDGIALALELAAARTRVMSVAEILDHLDERFRLLGGRRRSVERHQTLRSTIEWSFDLLEPDELDVACRCGVFAGGFDLAAAAAVNPDLDELDLVEILDALIRKSVVVAQQGRRTRYSMLETIRQYAEEQLSARGHFEATANAHAVYYAKVCREQQERWATPEQVRTYEWFERELPNARTAFNWSFDTGQLDLAADIAISTAIVTGYVLQYEGQSWVDRLLRVEGVETHPAYLELLVTGSIGAGDLGDPELGADRAEAALRIADERGIDALPPARHGRSFVTIALALAHRPRATDQAAIIRDTRDPLFLPALIRYEAEFGRSAGLVELCDDALAAADAADHPWARAFAADAATFVHEAIDRELALRHAEEAVSISEASRNEMIRVNALESVARLLLPVDEARALRTYLDVASAQMSTDSINVNRTFANVGAHLAEVGHDEHAAMLLGASQWSSTARGRRAQDELRTQLGTDAFEQLRATGKKMTTHEAADLLVDAIEERLRELEPATTEAAT